MWKDGVDQSPEVVGIFHVGLKKKKSPYYVILESAKNSPCVKKGFVEELCEIQNIPQGSELKLLGVIFQYKSKYTCHVGEKLVKAN